MPEVGCYHGTIRAKTLEATLNNEFTELRQRALDAAMEREDEREAERNAKAEAQAAAAKALLDELTADLARDIDRVLGVTVVPTMRSPDKWVVAVVEGVTLARLKRSGMGPNPQLCALRGSHSCEVIMVVSDLADFGEAIRLNEAAEIKAAA
jgi:hypothetical protein